MFARALWYLSVIMILLAGLESLGVDLYLAATQWLLVGIALAIWAVFLLQEAEFRLR